MRWPWQREEQWEIDNAQLVANARAWDIAEMRRRIEFMARVRGVVYEVSGVGERPGGPEPNLIVCARHGYPIKNNGKGFGLQGECVICTQARVSHAFMSSMWERVNERRQRMAVKPRRYAVWCGSDHDAADIYDTSTREKRTKGEVCDLLEGIATPAERAVIDAAMAFRRKFTAPASDYGHIEESTLVIAADKVLAERRPKPQAPRFIVMHSCRPASPWTVRDTRPAEPGPFSGLSEMQVVAECDQQSKADAVCCALNALDKNRGAQEPKP